MLVQIQFPPPKQEKRYDNTNLARKAYLRKNKFDKRVKMSNTYGKKFKKVIKNRRLTYDEVAYKLNLKGRQNINYMLNHQTDENWKYADIEKMCAVLRIPITYILGEK